MVKNTYLVRKDPSQPSSPLVEVKSTEWYQIVEENKRLPREKQRYFIVSTIEDGSLIDRMFMETSYEEFREWNIGKVKADKNRKAAERIVSYSLDAEPEPGNYSFLTEALTEDGTMEEAVYQRAAIERLRAAVKAWTPWAYDLLLCYEAGQKRSCTKELAEKYGISEQTMRKRKKLLEDFCKNFFES